MALTKLNFTGQGVLPTTSMPTDSVIQVKQVVIPKETITTASATFVSVGHSLAITPSATSSRILIEVRGGTAHCPYVDQWCISTIYRGSTNLSTTGLEGLGNSTTGLSSSTHNIVFLDSPNTTSEVTYTPYYKSSPTKTDCYWLLGGATEGSDFTITLTELAG
jgi:hypothetical protein